MAEVNTKFWLLTYDCFKKDVKKPEDNLILLVHWVLLNNDFKILGPGNENQIDENEKSAESLPINWSEESTYKLRYVRNKKLFLLSGVKVGDSLIFNFYNVTTKNVSSAAFGDISNTVLCICDMENKKNSFDELVNLLQKDLINPMQDENDDKKVASTQTIPLPDRNTRYPPLLTTDDYPGYEQPRSNFIPSYGMPDLDPLGGLGNPGGGMLFDPLRARPNRPFNPMFPGRFDPMHPGNPDPSMPGSFRRPNPDHMRPPTFDDDMYM